MAYEIPAPLRYEEKVLFGLSIWQSLWIALFASIALVVFIKTSIPAEGKAICAALLCIAAIGFAFFNLKAHLLSALGFFSRPREFGYFDAQMRKFMEVEKIERETVFMKNGSAKAILQARPINFNILSHSEKQAIISAYRDFLNSLDFPIQIAMRTVDLSMEDYLSRLEVRARQSKDEKIYRQFLEFSEFTKRHIAEKGAKNRLFYIILSYQQAGKIGTAIDKEKALSASLESLANRAKLCAQKLHNCNITTKRLSDSELAALLAGYFDCFVDVKEDYLGSVTSLKKHAGTEAPQAGGFGG